MNMREYAIALSALPERLKALKVKDVKLCHFNGHVVMLDVEKNEVITYHEGAWKPLLEAYPMEVA
jgi:hypothetical protein